MVCVCACEWSGVYIQYACVCTYIIMHMFCVYGLVWYVHMCMHVVWYCGVYLCACAPAVCSCACGVFVTVCSLCGVVYICGCVMRTYTACNCVCMCVQILCLLGSS